MFIYDNDDSRRLFEDRFEKWKNSEHGKYVLENSKNVTMISDYSYSKYKYQKQYAVTAEFEEKKLVEYYLKWSDIQND